MRFDYLEPDTLESAVRLLQEFGERAKILAGGTDLIVQMKTKAVQPEFVIHIGRIEEIKGIAPGPDGSLWIGALTTMRTIEKFQSLPDGFDLLRQGASQVSSPQIRNVATLGGNLCNGIPSADTVPALIALGARAFIVSSEGKREVPVEEFHVAPGLTVLKSNELLLGFSIPCQPPFSGGTYFKHTPRGTFELAIVGVAAHLTLDPGDLACKRARIVLGACGPTPLRARKAESLLEGSRMDNGLIEEASQAAAGEARPNPGVSVRASASHRRKMVAVWTRRAIKESWNKALTEGPN